MDKTDINVFVMENLFFYLGLAFILTHEMDAVRQKEWVIFPGLSQLTDRLGYLVFTALHIPLYGLLFYGLAVDKEAIIRALDYFFMIHVGLHLLFLRHPENPFKSFFSWFLIVIAGVCGLLDLVYE